MPSEAATAAELPPPEYLPLPRAALTLRRVGALALCLLPLAPLSLVLSAFLDGWVWWTVVTVLACVLGGLALIWAGASWRRFGFALSATGLHVRSGVVWHSEILLPRSRVQHTDVARGPLARRLGLSTLKVYTAGTRHSSVEVAGLLAEDAESLRDALTPAGEDAL